ncbi:MAG TPA: PilX N-terminal domain-containing pilus assembly protein [Usitatibacter sp.]|nr:PilX N-terminal domain-containing pilus assembly protein [Usitatibacter sp.]
MSRRPGRERGVTLLVALVMLVMLTLFALTAMNTSVTNLRMVGNMQERTEALDAAQATLELAISTTAFAVTPANAIPNPCGAANTTCTDVNGDGVPEYTTTLTPVPACVQARAIKVSELNIPSGGSASSEDVACVQGQQQQFGVAGAAPTGDSLCGAAVWNITAQTLQSGTTTTNSDVNVTAVQGVGIRMKQLDLSTNCP